MKRSLKVAAIAGTGAVLMTACSIGNTSPQSVGLHYSNGPLDSKAFVNCIAPGQRNIDDVNDDHFYYPTGQRTYKFSTDEGSDSAPLGVSTKNGVELIERGTVTFTLNTDCTPFKDKDGKEWPGGKLQKFHETIGTKFGAASTDTEQLTGAGWNVMVNTYVKDVIDRALDAEGQKYDWQTLYNDANQRAEWERAAITAVPNLVKAQMGEDFIEINNILLQKPDIPEALKADMAAQQGAVIRQQTAQIEQQAAQNWPGGIDAYMDYQQQNAVNKAITEGKVQVIPIPQGSPVIVNPGR